jgi:hypothetical protein
MLRREMESPASADFPASQFHFFAVDATDLPQ